MGQDRSSPLLVVCATFIVGIALAPRIAFAAPKDAAAQKLQSDAMGNDYVATKFAEAEKKLRSAISTCGSSGCSPKVQALILRDLGVVLLDGLKKEEDARTAFEQAVALDPKVSLDKDLSTPEAQSLLEEVKKAPQGGGGAKSGGAAAAAPAQGDFAHTPPEEQALHTPLPIFVEVPAELGATKVRVRYQSPGASSWKTAPMKKMEGGYGVEIDCASLHQAGEFSYYIQALDETGSVVGTSGSKAAPYVVQVKAHIEGKAPHLPGKSAPKACDADASPAEPECPEGETCEGAEVSAGTGTPCTADTDCEAGHACGSDGICEGSVPETSAMKRKANWLGIGIQQDFAMIGSAADICSPDQQSSAGWACFRGDGVRYSGNPQLGVHDQVEGGGFKAATTRILAMYDRVITKNISVGGRLGLALGGAPASFMPVHFEVRGAYWFGADPFVKKGLRPYAAVSGGLGQVDSKFVVAVAEDRTQSSDQTDNPDAQKLDAWRHMGQMFLGLSGGAVYMVNQKIGILGELRLSQLFPSSGTVFGLQVGGVYGL